MFAAVILAGATSFAIPGANGSATPGSEGPGMVVTMVTAGQVDPNGIIPKLNGVSGAGVNNWDIAIPTGTLSIGQTYVVEAVAADNNYTGPCSGYFELTQSQAGKKVVLGKYVFQSNGDCSPGFTYGGSDQFTIPNSPGAATLSGVIKYGSKKNVLNVPMVIQ